MDNEQSKPLEFDTELQDHDKNTYPNYDRSFGQYGPTKLIVNIDQLKLSPSGRMIVTTEFLMSRSIRQ